MTTSVQRSDLPGALAAGECLHLSHPACLHAARLVRAEVFGNRALTAVHRLTVGLAEGIEVRVDTDVAVGLGHACGALRGSTPSAGPLMHGIAIIVGRALAAGTELGFYPAAGDRVQVGARVTLVDDGRGLAVAPEAVTPLPAFRA